MIINSTFVTSFFGTLLGGLLAFLSSLAIEQNKRNKELKSNSKKLLLIMMNNNDVIEKIKELVDNSSSSLEDKYNDIFSQYNFNYTIHPIDAYFADVQSYLHTKYKKPIRESYGIDTYLYYMIFDIVKMQSLIVNLQNNPVKDTDIQTKEQIIKSFEEFYKRYKEKYSKAFGQKEIIKQLKK